MISQAVAYARTIGSLKKSSSPIRRTARKRLAAGQPRDRARDSPSEPAEESRLRALVGFFGEVLGNEFGEADQRDIHLVVFEPFLHHHAAIRTGGDNRIDTDFLDL
jgi:hypothetical protein